MVGVPEHVRHTEVVGILLIIETGELSIDPTETPLNIPKYE